MKQHIRHKNCIIRILFVWGFFVSLFFLPAGTMPTAQAQEPEEAPLEITADDTLEWHRNEMKFIARGQVIAAQGDVEIRSSTLTAHYRETDRSAIDIYRINADKNVIINSNEATAYGDEAVYDIDKGQAVMTGDNLKMISPDQIVTARDNFEYFVTDGRLIANGAVKIVRGEDTITTDRAIAFFSENAQGKRELQRLEAKGNVVITTPTEVLYGDQGHYDAASNIAEIYGNVKITRGPNILEGERAEVNLTTNISRMFGGTPSGDNTGGTGRVRGVFYPDSDNPPARD